MIVIGTAGHIDHGKTAVVKRLTGTDPDRLPEEKKRGMTIDLGFAFYTTPANDELAFVDVPGHERFVKNMIAGVGGIDVVMLVIAADDGWMPQSQEHFQIVRLLDLRYGLIVINKIDMVEPDWLELLQHEIKQKVAGSFLENAPIFKVSAQTGAGFDALTEYLNEISGKIASRRNIDKARLYIDRSFIQAGIGGVVTGTLRGGTLEIGQSVTVWPSMTVGRVRTLHSRNKPVEKAYPSQRTAVSFTGIDKEYLVRGGVVSTDRDLSFFRRNQVFALAVELLPETIISIDDRRKVLVIVGTSEVEGELRMYDRKQLNPGERGLVFFKPDRPLLAFVGDNYIMRLVTPMVTLGGGKVLDLLERFPRRKQLDRFVYLNNRVDFSLDSLLVSEFQKNILQEITGLLDYANYSRTEIAATVETLVKTRRLGKFGRYVYHQEHLESVVAKLKSALLEFLREKPHLKGLSAEEITRLSGLSDTTAHALIEFLVQKEELVKEQELYNLPGRGMSLKGVIRQAHDSIMQSLREQPYGPPTLASLAAGGKVHQNAIKYIIDTGEACKCGGDFLFLSEVWREIITFIKKKLNTDSRLTVPELRDRFGFTRKYVIPVLEETDRQGLTCREGDVRVKGDKFDDEKFNL
ncbi:MAG: selenocysteine-specific translation elongation factor [Candidatus Zixiibacteriota bacterium]